MSAVLITGAAKRIGRKLAETCAAQGFAVALHCHQSRADADKLAEQIGGKTGGNTTVIQFDLAALTLAQADDIIQKASDALGEPLTCLINNASLFARDDAQNMDEKSWEAHININLRAPIFLSRAFARQKPPQGQIIMMLDQKVWRPTPHFFSYTMSKMALWDATRLLAQAFAPEIRVNAIGPGSVLPNPFQSDQQFEQMIQATPLQRGASLDEIADAMLFVMRQPAITGQMIALDGGKYLAFDK